MQKTTTPNIPGMTDTLEFVKNLWGGMNVPGVGGGMAAGAPMSTDELDKKIADLKAVEAWLNMNMTMLRGTIQALEVQRGTIATLKSVGESMAQAMGQAGEQANAMAAPFAQFFNQPGAGAPANGAGHAKPQAAAQGGAHGGAQAGAAKSGAEPPPFAAGIPAAMAWWNLLQEQFSQAVASAMSAPEVMAGAAAMAQDAAARFAAASTPASAGKGEARDKPGASKPKPDKPGPDKS